MELERRGGGWVSRSVAFARLREGGHPIVIMFGLGGLRRIFCVGLSAGSDTVGDADPVGESPMAASPVRCKSLRVGDGESSTRQ